MSNIEDVRVPELGENIEAAEVVTILVEVGQTVTVDESLIEVESDKASLEIPSTVAGTINEIKVSAGDQIKAGQAIVSITVDANTESPQPESKDKSEASIPAQAVPPIANTSAPAIPKEQAYAKGGELVDINTAAQKPVIQKPIAAGPAVRRLARELGVNLQKVEGTGPRSRVLKIDVKDYVKRLVERREHSSTGNSVAVPDMPKFENFGPVRHEKMSGIRRKIAERMSFATSHIPHVTQFDEADITSLEAFRKTKGKEAQKRGAKLTVTVMLLKIMALALKKFPVFNASLDLKHDEILYKEYINIGVAVDTDRGLLVPVIKDADTKGIWQLSAELNDLASRARERKIKPDELQGGNISLTNLGGLGTTHFTPIINWPDVAVMGVGRAKERAVMIDGEWQAHMIMPLSLSYDHRIIDGADAARFLRWICEGLESPMSVLL